LQDRLKLLGLEVPPAIRSSLAQLEYYERRNAIVLCGLTGAGKSTLLNVLLGFPFLPAQNPDDTDGVSVTPIAIEIRRSTMAPKISLEFHLTDDASWRSRRSREIKWEDEGKSKIKTSSNKFLSRVFGQHDHPFEFDNKFAWSSNIAELEKTTFSNEPVSIFLRSKRIISNSDASPEKIKAILATYLGGPLAVIIKKIVLMGSFPNSYLPEDISIFDLPGSGDDDLEKEWERQAMMKRARYGIIVVNASGKWQAAKDSKTMFRELNDIIIDDKSFLNNCLFAFNRFWPASSESNVSEKWHKYKEKAKFENIQQSFLNEIVTINEANCVFVDNNATALKEMPAFRNFYNQQIHKIKKFLTLINVQKEEMFLSILETLRASAFSLAIQRSESDPPATEHLEEFEVKIDKWKKSVLQYIFNAKTRRSDLFNSFKKTVELFTGYWNSSSAFVRHSGIYSGRTGSCNVPQEFTELLYSAFEIDYGVLGEHLGESWRKYTSKSFHQSLKQAIARTIHSAIMHNYRIQGFVHGPYYDSDSYVTEFMRQFWIQWPSIYQQLSMTIENQFNSFMALVEQRVLSLITLHTQPNFTADKIQLAIPLALPDVNHKAVRLIMKSIYELFKIWMRYNPGYEFKEVQESPPYRQIDFTSDACFVKPTLTSLVNLTKVLNALQKPSELFIRYVGISDEHIPVLQKYLDDCSKFGSKLLTIDITGNSVSQDAIQQLNSHYRKYNFKIVDYIKYFPMEIKFPAAPTRRIGIVIGNSNYAQSIGSCKANQEHFSRFLIKCNFNVLDKHDINSRSEWDELICNLKTSVDGEATPVLFVFYYSGHGGLLRSKNCIQSTDNTIIPLTALYQALSGVTNSTSIFVLDCCQADIDEASVEASIRDEASEPTFPRRSILTFACCPLNFGYGPIAEVPTLFTAKNVEHLERARYTSQSVMTAIRAASDAYNQTTDIQRGQPLFSVSNFPDFTL
jgi:energy-coupling factor transporter ATP-binding protein EcfA2